MSILSQRLLYAQLGCFLTYAVVLVMLATAKSLYVQVHRQVPQRFSRALWAIAIFNHLCSIPIFVGNMLAYEHQSSHLIMQWFAANAFLFTAIVALLLFVYWFLFINLRRRVTAFIAMMQRSEDKKRAEMAANAAALAQENATKLALMRAAALQEQQQQQQAQRALAQVHPQQHPNLTAAEQPPSAPAMRLEVPGAVTASSGASVPGVPDAAELADSPSGGEALRRALARQFSTPILTVSHDAGGGPTSFALGVPALPGGRAASARVRALGHNYNHSADAAGAACPAAQREDEDQDGGGMGMQQPEVEGTALPQGMYEQSCYPLGSLAAFDPSLALSLYPATGTVHSPPRAGRVLATRPATAADVGGNTLAPVRAGTIVTAGGTHLLMVTAASPVPSLLTPVATATDLRLLELTRALRKLVLVTALVTLLLVGTVCAQVPTLMKYLEGGVIASVVRSPTHSSDPYPATNALAALVNQGALATIVWYAWTDPVAWLTARGRHAQGLGDQSLWKTLLRGAEANPALLARYELTKEPTRVREVTLLNRAPCGEGGTGGGTVGSVPQQGDGSVPAGAAGGDRVTRACPKTARDVHDQLKRISSPTNQKGADALCVSPTPTNAQAARIVW